MYEIDFLPVGDGENSGDAIALRFTHPGTGRTVAGVIDGGYQDDGDDLVAHIKTVYGSSAIDFVVCTHPDGDHIGGLGKVVRNLSVGTLFIHRPALHGYPNNSGSSATEELVVLAEAQGSNVVEPFMGVETFAGALLFAGPSQDYYEEMLAAQVTSEKTVPPAQKSLAAQLSEAAVRAARRVLDAFPGEVFFDDAGGTNPRNNSATVIELTADGERFLFTADVGVPALNHALDYVDSRGRTAYPLNMLQLPHHGSRKNLDRETIERLLGPHKEGRHGVAVASHSELSPRYPSPRIANAVGRRGYPVFQTAGSWLCHPGRAGSSRAVPLPPLAETD